MFKLKDDTNETFKTLSEYSDKKYVQANYMDLTKESRDSLIQLYKVLFNYLPT